MNLFSNQPFLQHFPGNRPAANGADSYARGYGNRIASAEVFAPLGHGQGNAGRRQPDAGSRSPAGFANDPCPLGACG